MRTTTRRKRRAYAPRVPAEQRRSELLDAALHLIVARGYRAATVEAIAEQAGVTKPVLYALYANRADLLADLLRREQGEGLAQLLSVLPPRVDGSDLADLADLAADVLDRFLRLVRAAPDRWMCIVMPLPDMPAEFHDARERARDVALSRIEDLLRAYLGERGAPADFDAEIAAHSVFALAEMATRLVLTDPERYAPARFAAAMRVAVRAATS